MSFIVFLPSLPVPADALTSLHWFWGDVEVGVRVRVVGVVFVK